MGQRLPDISRGENEHTAKSTKQQLSPRPYDVKKEMHLQPSIECQGI